MWFRTQDRDDPRHRLTETGFRVEPGLLGRPLAHPLRRLAATLLDLLAVGGLVLSRTISPWLFALVAAWLLWRVADPDADIRLPSRGLEKLFRWTAVTTAAVAILAMVGGLFPDDDEPPSGSAGGAAAGSMVAGIADSSPPAGEQAGTDGVAYRTVLEDALPDLRRAASADSVRDRAAVLALELYRSGAPRDRIEEEVADLLDDVADEAAWEAEPEAVTAAALARLDSTVARREAVRDSLLRALAAAADSGSAANAPRLAARLLGTPPRPDTRQLEARIQHLEQQLEAARRPPGPIDLLLGTLDDLGLGLGWLGVYFTAFLTLWRGRTPGKRLLGIRVVRVDGEPLTTWDAFSRFGGYAASVLTGLLGFAQLLWHPNRQALHDRIAGTVVIRE